MSRIFKTSVFTIFMIFGFVQSAQAASCSPGGTGTCSTYINIGVGGATKTVKISESGNCKGTYSITSPAQSTYGNYGDGGVNYRMYMPPGYYKITLKSPNWTCIKASISVS